MSGRKKCKYEQALRVLVAQNQQFMRWLDAEMIKPSNATRGGRIAQAVNELGIAVDRVRFFTLGVNYRNDKTRTFGNTRTL